MSDSNNGNVVEIQTRDQLIMQARLKGESVAVIAKRHKVQERVVLSILDKLLPTLSSSTRAQYLRLSISQLDALSAYWWERAETSPTAATLVLKINESRRQLLGLDAPTRLDLVQILSSAKPEQTSTDELLDALNRIANEKSVSGLQLEHESDPAS
jgi:hypothetical protein